jgi:predicted metalloprotease with PDZ domain
MTQALRYRIYPRDPAAHLFEVTLTVPAPNPNGQVVAMPAWIPGSYMIRDYARHVVSIRAESKGREIRLDKLDKSRWQSEPVDGPLTIIADIYAYDPSVRGAHLDLTHAYFNGTCVFFAVEGQEAAPCLVEVAAPDAPIGEYWRVATSMRRKDAPEYGFGIYEANNYAELIDHPVEIAQQLIGEFEADGIRHAIAVRGKTRVDIERVCADLKTLCEQHMRLLGAPDDLDRYLFLLQAPGTGYGGLEHRWSSSLVCSRDDLPKSQDKDVSNGYRTFLGLASHEYFHLWNIKRMKPAAFTPYDLSTEVHTGLLWVFEGITSYYDDLALVRSGLISVDSYLELVGQTITRVLRTPGRLRQSVEESSFDAWTKFYKQDANATNAIVSYYAKGALIALALDLTIRTESDGRASLDDVMRECWRRWGQSGEGMPERGLEIICAEVTGLDLGEFFDVSVRGTDDWPLDTLLDRFGVTYNLRQAASRDDKGGKPSSDAAAPWLGATLVEQDGKSVFAVVTNGGPAELAGVAPGDVAVALDGMALSATNCDRRLKSYCDDDHVELVVFRGDELLTLPVRLAEAPETTCYLQLDKEADADALARQAAWLQPD